MSVAAALNKLGQKVLPKVVSKAFPDLMAVVGKTGTSDGAGGQVKATSTVYDNVPCAYAPTAKYEQKMTASDVQTSFERYIVTFATHTVGGTRLNINPGTHRLTVKARGGANGEPAKTFRIITIRDNAGVVFEAVCEKEN